MVSSLDRTAIVIASAALVGCVLVWPQPELTAHTTDQDSMGDTSLLDLPDELLIRCLAGSGGMGIGASAAACTRLLALSNRLKQLPVFSSALSTHASLQQSIKDAAQRALIGCYGAEHGWCEQ